MRYLELFAGAGGLSMGLEAAGMVPVAHAEIEPHACAVLRHHWPDTDLLGNVTALAGGRRMKRWMRSRYLGVDVVAGGSPCQDLSVAGKRAGLDGARSGLFHKQVRIWKILEAPYLIWENVVGALSSQHGRDFAVVLSTLVGATVHVPKGGWRTSGVAAGATGVAAWRVLDLQHVGPPQRRRRVFVVAARAGAGDPAEILALSEGVCGHPSPRERAREATARGAEAGPGGCDSAVNISDCAPRLSDTFGSLQARANSGGIGSGAQMQAVLSFAENQRGELRTSEVTPQLTAGGGKPGQGYSAVLAFKPSHYTRGKDGAPSDVWPPLSADADKGDQEALAFHHTQDPISGDVSPAIGGTTDGMGVVANTITAREAKGWNPPRDVGNGTVQHGRPRRLTPLECERLMGWPDQWTAAGTREDGTTYHLNDSARYRICGNGVGAPVAAWIGRRFMEAHAGLPPR